MDVVTIDFETYYDKEYSLRRMTTEAYIRDDKFEVIGVCVKVNDGPTDWYSGSDVRRFLNSLDYSKRAILCHNTAFDGAILSWHYGINPALWLDTLSMARPLYHMVCSMSLKGLSDYLGLGAKGDEIVNTIGKHRADFTPAQLRDFADYCIQDVELTYKLFNKLRVGFPAAEIRVIDIALRMYTEPVIEVDTGMLWDHVREIQARKAQLIANMISGGAEDDPQGMLMSNAKFAKALLDHGVAPPMKRSLTTGKPTYAFAKKDAEFQALLDHPDTAVQTLVAARLGVKSTIDETRSASIINAGERGPLPIMLNYYSAHTGRFSGGDKLNLQNLPRGGAIRKALKAPDGKVFITCDSSQIEARVTAYLAEQKDLLDAFRDGRDVYSEFATDVYGYPVTKAQVKERFVGKTSILGLGFGMGPDKFMDTLTSGAGGMAVDIDLDEARRVVRLYRHRNHKIATLWTRADAVLRALLENKSGQMCNILPFDGDGIILPTGFRIKYPMLESQPDGFRYINNVRALAKLAKARVLGRSTGDVPWTYIYGCKVVENVVQAVARIVVAEQMVRIAKRHHVVLQVHDENVVCTDEDRAEDVRDFMVEVMSTPPTWAPDLPVACEAGIGKSYGEAK